MLKADAKNNAKLFSSLAAAAFDRLDLSGEAVVEVVTVSDEEIRSLNASARGIDRATDVLSFPALDKIVPFTRENYPYDYDEERGAVELGSIVISSDRAAAQAKEYGHSLRRETAYLFVHGLMHLLGYDHETEEDKAVMREKEELVLAACGITRGDDK